MWHPALLAIGAVLLGADRVKGVDSDRGAVRVATENAELLDTEVGFIVADVKDEALRGLLGSCDTVIMLTRHSGHRKLLCGSPVY